MTPLIDAFEFAKIPHPVADIAAPADTDALYYTYQGDINYDTPVIFIGPKDEIPKPP